MKTFFQGQKVKWQYTHHLNSRSQVERVKYGVALRQQRDRKTGAIINPEFVLVKFDGNKTLSKVKLEDLEPKQNH